MRVFWMTATCAVSMLAASAGLAQTPAAAPPAPAAAPAQAPAITAADRKFITDAMLHGGVTIQTSQLALQRTTNDAVKQFAQKAISDQTETNKQLTQFAALNGVTAPAANPSADAAVKQLDGLNGKAFDKRYAQIMSGNETALTKLFHEQEHSTQNKILAHLAGDALPSYEEDSDKAEQLASAVAKEKAPAKSASNN